MRSGKTAVIEARLDYATLASLHKYFADKGHIPTSRSDLVWKAVEALATILEANSKMERFLSIEEAYLYMRASGMEDMFNGGRRGKASFTRAMQEDALTKDGFDPSYASRVRSKSGEIKIDMGEVLQKTREILASQGAALPRPSGTYVDEATGEVVEWKDKPVPDLSATPIPSVET